MKVRGMRKHNEDTSASIREMLAKVKVPKSVVLAMVPSATTKGKTYNIRMGATNSVYCECNGFKYRNRCAHMDRFRNEHTPQILK